MCAALLLVPADRLAALSWSLDLGVEWADRYLFRGVILTGEDQAVLAANATLTVGKLSLWSYGYRGDFDGENGEGDFREVDFGADYTFSRGRFSLTLGAQTYLYTQEVETGLGFSDSAELSATVAWEVTLTPTVSYHHDVDRVSGGYLRIGIGHSFPAGDRVSVDLSGAVGVDNKYNGEEAFKPNDLLLGLDVPWQVTDRFSLHTMVEHSIALEVLDELEVDDETVLTVGAGLSF
jgi:hypothetical protein